METLLTCFCGIRSTQLSENLGLMSKILPELLPSENIQPNRVRLLVQRAFTERVAMRWICSGIARIPV